MFWKKSLKFAGIFIICLSLLLNVYWLRGIYIKTHPNMGHVYFYNEFNGYLRTASYFLELSPPKPSAKENAQAIYDAYRNIEGASINQGKFELLLKRNKEVPVSCLNQSMSLSKYVLIDSLKLLATGETNQNIELVRKHFRYLSEHLPKELNNPKELDKLQVVINEFNKIYCDDNGAIKPSPN